MALLSRKVAVLSLTGIALSVSCCGERASTQAAPASPVAVTTSASTPTPTATPSPSSTTSDVVVGTNGGSASLPGIAMVSFPAGSLRSATRVKISEEPLSTDDKIGFTSDFLSVQALHVRSVRISLSGAIPVSDTGLTLAIPATLFSTLRADQTIAVLGSFTSGSDEEEDTSEYEVITGKIDKSTLSIAVSVKPYFLGQQSGNEIFGTFTIVSVPK